MKHLIFYPTSFSSLNRKIKYAPSIFIRNLLKKNKLEPKQFHWINNKSNLYKSLNKLYKVNQNITVFRINIGSRNYNSFN